MDLNMNSMNHVAKCSGKIIFSPNRPGLKKSHRSFDNGVILKVDNGITISDTHPRIEKLKSLDVSFVF